MGQNQPEPCQAASSDRDRADALVYTHAHIAWPTGISADGATPNLALKSRENCDGCEKPRVYATSLTRRDESSNCRARCRRSSRNQVLGEQQSWAPNKRCKWRCETPIRVASSRGANPHAGASSRNELRSNRLLVE